MYLNIYNKIEKMHYFKVSLTFDSLYLLKTKFKRAGFSSEKLEIWTGSTKTQSTVTKNVPDKTRANGTPNKKLVM